jgi:hypothetical protein
MFILSAFIAVLVPMPGVFKLGMTIDIMALAVAPL